MVVKYYKATRPDGTDFHTGRVDYAGALVSGEVVRHSAARRVRDDASTYLSVSVSPTDCTGARWPCRLFEVAPVGRPLRAEGIPSKRCVSAVRVVAELDARLALGPNADAVLVVLGQAARLPQFRADDPRWAASKAWAARWPATAASARYAAQAAAAASARLSARYAAQDAAQDAVWAARWGEAWSAWWAAARYAAASAAGLVVRDLITDRQCGVLCASWGAYVDAFELGGVA